MDTISAYEDACLSGESICKVEEDVIFRFVNDASKLLLVI